MVDELEKGYFLKDKLLRPARVIVSTRAARAADPTTALKHSPDTGKGSDDGDGDTSSGKENNGKEKEGDKI